MSSNAQPAKDPAHGRHAREVEWQLACADLASVRRWLAGHGTVDGLSLEPRSTLQILDTYLDTDDWRIHRAGFALRIRSESGKLEATLKSLQSASAEVADRLELSETLERADGETIRHSLGPVGTRVQAVSGTHALLPLFEVRTSRERIAIRKDDEAQPVGEIALDDTVISRPHGEPQATLQRVEVESFAENREPLQSLVETLRSGCALEAAPETKYASGLKSVGLTPVPAPAFAPTAVDASMPVAEVARANLRRHLSAWHLHEPRARLGDDPEGLHDLRVAGRRLDANLRQFRSFLPASIVRARPALKKILRVLGEARDLDIALCELEQFSRRLPAADRDSVEPLKQQLWSERGKARARMLNTLDSTAAQKMLQDLASLLAAPCAPSAQSSSEPALSAAPRLIRRRYRKMRNSAARLTPQSSMEAYHEVRRRVKKLRYALEAVAVIYGKPADRMLRALNRWQDRLGIQQDAAVASQRLKALSGAPPPGFAPATLFMMGRLVEHHEAVALGARKGFAKGLRRVRRRWKRLRAEFEDPALRRASAPAATKP
jgi:triphosphatase